MERAVLQASDEEHTTERGNRRIAWILLDVKSLDEILSPRTIAKIHYQKKLESEEFGTVRKCVCV